MRRVLAGALVALGLIAFQGPSTAAPSKTYVAPFAIGPSGGDSDGYASADPQGRVTVFRAYPAPGPINCPGAGHFANLKVMHKLTGAVHKVTAAYDTTFVDPYVHVSVSVRDATGRFIGNAKPAGATGSGSIAVPVRWDNTVRGPLQITFGLEVATACPHVDGGTINFTSVTVSG
ncbi:MAG: hypothetical protein QOI82_2770 [Actinomycetota bacterium]|jgi:hypothetical protein|nr:hypothetical protein [Actinomycetota bacterium]